MKPRNLSLKTVISCLCLAFVYFVAADARGTATFIAGRDFTPSSNPGTVWSYGWKSNAVGNFNTMTQAWTTAANNGVQIKGWILPVYTEPAVYWNTSTNDAVFGGGTAVVPAYGLWVHPGMNGRPENLGVIRFTAPSNGIYSIATQVEPLYSASGPAGDTDFHVIKGGTEVFSAYLTRIQGTNHNSTWPLYAGDTLDFAVGRGMDLNEFGSALKLGIEIDVAPLASSPGLVSLWRAEGNASDSVGGNHGIGVNSVDYANGVNGRAFSFRGNSFVRVTNSPSLQLSNELTVLAWFKRDATIASGNAFTLIDKRDLATCNFGVNMSSDHGLQLYFNDGNGFKLLSSPLPSGGVWHHFAGTYSQKTNGVELIQYLDGVAVITNLFSGSLASSVNNSPLAIGSARNGATEFFKGLVDEVSILNLALNAGQVLAEFNAYTPPVDPPPAPKVPKLISLWSGQNSASDSVGINHGSNINQVAYVPGVVGQAFKFNGNNFIRIPDSESLGLGDELTIQLWFNRDSSLASGGSYTLFDKRDLSSCNYGANMSTDHGLQLYYNSGGGFKISQTTLPTASQWHHYAGTYRQLSNNVELVQFLDGQPVVTNLFSGTLAPALNNAPLSIGANRDGAAEYFRGLIDEVALYNFALSPSQILSNFSSVVPPPPPVEYGNFDAGRDFTTGSNPGDVWSYGWKSAVSGSFNLLSQPWTTTADNGVQVKGWILAGPTEPAIYWNTSTNVAVFGGGTANVPGNGIWVHPGLTGRPENLGALRFTAPSNANYELSVAVNPLYSPSGPAGDTDFHIALQDSELFSAFLTRTQGTNYSAVVHMAEGQVLDLLVGRGADANEFGSALKLVAIVTPTTNAPNATNPPPVVPYTDFNLVRDFSLNGNPNGVWSYGWKSAPNGTFNSVTNSRITSAGSGVTVQIWEFSSGTPAYFLHFPASNSGTGSSDGGFGQYPPGTLIAQAGASSPLNLATIRFTAPSNGNYQVGVAARSYLDGGPAGDTDFHVILNGVELFSRFLPSVASTAYTNILALSVGDTIEFAAGRGADNNYYGSGLKIAALISPTTNAVVVTNPPAQTVFADFDAGRDFSVGTNPGGVWSYGWKTTEAGSFQVMGEPWTTVAGNGVQVRGWILPVQTEPAIYWNTSSNAAVFGGGTAVVPGHGIWIHPGLTGRPENLGVLRFTAPSNANYNVQASVEPLYSPSGPAGDTDFHVVLGTNRLLGAFLSRVQGTNYSGVVEIPAGGTLDVAVGRGADQVEYGSALKVNLVITPTTNVVTPVVTNTPPPPPPVYADFNLSRDYSAAGNPSGAWSFGWKGTVGGDFNLLSWLISANCDNGVPVNGWLLSSFGQPAVYGNTSTSTGVINQGQSILPPGTVWLHPGINGRPENYSVVRFTAPSNGNYQVDAAVAPLSNGGLAGDTDFHVAQNGVEVFGQYLSAQSGASFSNVLSLNTGDTVDFLAGRGADGNEFGSSLRLSALISWTTNSATIITNLPPPSTNPPPAGPVIVSQPTSQFVNLGETVTFSVNVTGEAPLHFQWLFNGVEIPEATAASLVLSNVQSSASGTYRVRVSNSAGTVTSDSASLSFNPSGGVPRINFANSSQNRVFEADGVTPAVGNGSLVVGFYVGVDAGSLQQVGGVVALPSFPGRFSGGIRSLENISGGQTVQVQVRIWDVNYGASYEAAVAAGSKHGASVVFPVLATVAPAPPSSLAAMPSFNLVLPSVPAPQITAGPASVSVLRSQAAALSVTATGGGLTYQWFHNGAAKPGAVGATFALASAQKSDAGDYFVVVGNTGGSVTSQVATLTVDVVRTLAAVSPAPAAEGDLISVPLVLESDGSVAGMTFRLFYNADLLSAPEVVWDAAVSNGLVQANVPVLGQVFGVFALNNGTIPAGTQTVATVNFRARTVVTNSTSDLLVDLVDVSNGSGDLLPYGNDVRSASASVQPGAGLVGDNNGNGRLDIGDASLLLRLLTQFDSVRPWDLPRNDLNTNSLIDSGDAIRILLAAATVETNGASALNRSKTGSSVVTDLASLNPRVGRSSGGLVTYQVRLDDVRGPISGAAFTLSYPPGVLRIADPQAQVTGSMVPAGSAVLWNVTPGNNYAAQNGYLRFVASSATAWSASTGVLAQITFQVQPGATNQYGWPISLSNMEVTSLGYNRTVAPTSGLFATRDAQPGQLGAVSRLPDGVCRFQVSGDPSALYVIEVSSNLQDWTPLTTVANTNGQVEFSDPSASGQSQRFYRARPINQ